MRQFCLFTYPPRSKWASSEKMFFFLPKSASSVSRSQASCSRVYTIIFVRRKDKTNYLSKQTWAKCYHSRNNDSFWMRRVFCAPNATILPVYIPAKTKMIFIWKDDFFFCQNRKRQCYNISQRCSSVSQPHSFGGKIKLIICQIRHELSVTIYEISSSWKKNVRWRTQ